MRDIDELMPFVLPFCPACPEPTAVHHLRSAAREFCQRTKTWRIEESSIPVLGQGREVQIVPQGTELVELSEVLFDGVPLEPIALNDLRDKVSGWRESTGQPCYITSEREGWFTLVPHQAGTLTVSMFLMPSLYADTLPDYLVDQHAECLADGALSKILLLPDQPFTSPAGADYRRGLFDKALANMAGRIVRGRQRAPIRSRARFV